MPSRKRLPPARKLSLPRKLLFAAIPTVVFLMTAEGVLRLTGYDSGQRLESMEFTFPIDDYNENSPQPFLERDRLLFWKPKPNVLGHNSLGFSGPEFKRSPENRIFRIVCLGDSCTHFGPDSYPHLLQMFLDHQSPGHFEVINAGVIGYTSYQGRVLLESQVLDWKPDLVTIYFGWNDHWLSRGIEDKRQAQVQLSNRTDTFENLRLLEFAQSLTGRLRRIGDSRPNSSELRVPPSDYHDNLRHMIQLCEAREIATLLITAPQAMDISIPNYLYTSGEVSDPSKLIALHARYNEIVMRIASESKAHVLDLAQKFDQLEKTPLFLDDHIHLSEQGRALAAYHLFRKIGEEGLADVGDIESIDRLLGVESGT